MTQPGWVVITRSEYAALARPCHSAVEPPAACTGCGVTFAQRHIQTAIVQRGDALALLAAAERRAVCPCPMR